MQRFSFLIGIPLLALNILFSISTPALGTTSPAESCQNALAPPLEGWMDTTFPGQETSITFTFHLLETGALSLEVTSLTSSAGGQIELLDGSCDPVSSSISWYPSHVVDILPAGTYHARVTGLDPDTEFRLQSAFTPLPEGQHAVALPEEPRDENDGLEGSPDGSIGIPCPETSGSDIGETILCALPIVLGGKLESSLDSHQLQDRDAFRFEVQSPVTLVIWADGLTDLVARVLDASNDPMATGSVGLATQELRTTLPAGTYTLLLESSSGAVGTYRVYSLVAPESWQGSSF